MDFEDLSPELQERVRECRTIEELHEILQEEGMEIPDEELDAIAGGAWCNAYRWYCPLRSCPGESCDSYHNNCIK